MRSFFNMGGYAAYLWPAYAITFAVVLLNVIWAKRLLTKARAGARRRLTVLAESASVGGTS